MTFTGPVDLGLNASAAAVNNSGRIAGDKDSGGKNSSAVWDIGTALPTLAEILGPPASNSNRCVSINELGQVVGIDARSAFVITPK
jgi:hypothetical protein